MKNLSIFEPQIEKHYAYKKKHVEGVFLVRKVWELMFAGKYFNIVLQVNWGGAL